MMQLRALTGSADIGQILTVLAGAKVFSELVSAHSGDFSRKSKREITGSLRFQFCEALLPMLSRSVVWSFLLLCAFLILPPSSIGGLTIIMLSAMVMLGAIRGLIQISIDFRYSANNPALGVSIATLTIWALVVSITYLKRGALPLGVVEILAIHILVPLIILLSLLASVAFIPGRDFRISPCDSCMSSNFSSIIDVASRNIDILGAMGFLYPSDAASYYLVRLFMSPIDFAMSSLKTSTEKAILVTFDQEGIFAFRRAAARLNLAYFLIGLAVCAFLMCISPLYFQLIQGDRSREGMITFWMILAMSTPAIFGSFEKMMEVSEQHTVAFTLRCFFVLFSGLCITFVDISDPVELAKVYALCRLMYTATGAAIVGKKLGVWPGCTALLHKELRIT